VPAMRCRAVLEGIAVRAPSDAALDRSSAFDAAARTIEEWDKTEADEDERLPMLRAVARSEFGRRGYEATTVRDIAAAAGLSVGSVYRLIGSKDELLGSIMRSFTVKARSGWSRVLQSDATTVEKLDALTWININTVDHFSDEYNIQLAWIRESPPNTVNLGASFSARLTDLKSLLAQGLRAGELRVEGPSADIRAWSVFELLWMPENIVRALGPRDALILARETTLRGAAPRS
jgi:AcrR family transcriptional regulator